MSAFSGEAHKGHLCLPNPCAVAWQASSLLHLKAIPKVSLHEGLSKQPEIREKREILAQSQQDRHLSSPVGFAVLKFLAAEDLQTCMLRGICPWAANANFQTDRERVGREESANQGLTFENGSAALNSLLKYEPAKSRCCQMD